MPEPIDLPFGLWTRAGWTKHWFSRICQVVPMCHCGRSLAQPGEYDRTVHLRRQCALCQITLTTCYYSVSQLVREATG